MIKDTISDKLNIDIENWDEAFVALDKQGRITQRELFNLVIILCKTVESLEESITLLHAQAEEKRPTTKAPLQSAKA